MLSLLRGSTLLWKVLGGISIVGVLLFALSQYKENIFEDGYNQAVQEYQVLLIQQQEYYKQDTENKLIKLRQTLAEDYNKEILRVKKEASIDAEIQTVTEYIEKEVFIPVECNVVDPNLISLFNNKISNINTSRENQP